MTLAMLTRLTKAMMGPSTNRTPTIPKYPHCSLVQVANALRLLQRLPSRSRTARAHLRTCRSASCSNGHPFRNTGLSRGGSHTPIGFAVEDSGNSLLVWRSFPLAYLEV